MQDSLDDHLIRIEIIEAGGGAGYWVLSGTDVSLIDPEYDILFEDTEQQFHFGDSETRIEWDNDEIYFYADDSLNLKFEATHTHFQKDILPGSDSGQQIGGGGLAFGNMTSYRYTFTETEIPGGPPAGFGIIYMDKADDKL